MAEMRAIVVGTSCSGKTTVARRISSECGLPHIELDELFWGPNWTEPPTEEFLKRVRTATAVGSWVLDGNYGITREITWPRATHLLWLNLPFPLVLWRSVKRTFGRMISKEEMWAGNTESFRVALSRNSIIWWVITTYGRRKRRYRRIFNEKRYPHLVVYQASNQLEVDAAIAKLLSEFRSPLQETVQ